MKKLFSILLIVSSVCYGQTPEHKKGTYVDDYAGVLTPQQISVLNDSISAIEKRSSVQLAVVLVSHLPENTSIEDYANSIGRTWHVGNANNGLVYVAAILDRKQRLEVASALEGDITDIDANNIQEKIKPFFRADDYFGGLQQMIRGVNDRVDPAIKKQLALAQEEQDKISEQRWDRAKTIFLWLGTAGVLYFLLWLIYLRPMWRRKEK